MSLRVTRPGPVLMDAPATASTGDGWASRLAKLIPAEALGLYGAGSSLVQGPERAEGRWLLAAACLAFAGALRFVATRDQAGKPQWLAIGIAVVSFVLWMAALPADTSPISLGARSYLAGLLALIWATAVPAFYKGT